VTFAYDGSGVALRAKATILKTFADTARVKIAESAQAIKVLGGKVAVVPKTDLSAVDSPGHVASFGWLD
jgi:hypothetical protein